MKPQKMKGRSLLKIKIPAETDNDASKFPRTVFQIAQKKKKKKSVLIRTAQDAPNLQEKYI